MDLIPVMPILLRIIACIWCATLFFPYFGNMCAMYYNPASNEFNLWLWWSAEIAFNLTWIFHYQIVSNPLINATKILICISVIGFCYHFFVPYIEDDYKQYIYPEDFCAALWNAARIILLSGFLYFG